MPYEVDVVELPPEHDKVLARQVANVLMNAGELMHVAFTYAGVTVSYYQFNKVAQHILNGHMFIAREDGRTIAAYNQYVDSMTFPPDIETSSWSSRANIVHEATHAICDMEGVTILQAEAETMAYVAQAMYLRLNSPDYKKGQKPSGTDGAGPLRKAAFAIGDVMLKGNEKSAFTPKRIMAIRAALGPIYEGINDEGSQTVFNGLGSTWRLGIA